MKLNWTKIAVYSVIIGVGLLIAIETRTPPKPTPPPVVQSEPAPPVVVPPPVVRPEPTPPLVVVPPPPFEWKTEPLPPTLEIVPLRPRVVRPRPVVKPDPVARPVQRRPRPKSHFEPKPVSHNPECRDVPAAAYQHPTDVVLAAAKRMGVPQDKLVVLKRCIGS